MASTTSKLTLLLNHEIASVITAMRFNSKWAMVPRYYVSPFPVLPPPLPGADAPLLSSSCSCWLAVHGSSPCQPDCDDGDGRGEGQQPKGEVAGGGCDGGGLLLPQEEDRNEPNKYDDAFRSLRSEIFKHTGTQLGQCGGGNVGWGTLGDPDVRRGREG